MADIKKFLDQAGISHLWTKITAELNKKVTLTDLAAVATSGAASDINLIDTGSYYTSTDVEGALQEIGAEKANLSDIPEVPVQNVQINNTSILNAQGIANIPLANQSTYGATKIGDGGITIDNNSALITDPASSSNIKSGLEDKKPITPQYQHESAFYGLAKAAGDITQSSSANNIGNYTESAKSAISTMLNGSIIISGTNPVITASPGISYICGEVMTLQIIVPASGIIDVIFKSGTTPTVLTITSSNNTTIQWANDFDPSTLETNTTYEINIMNGLGVIGQWI